MEVQSPSVGANTSPIWFKLAQNLEEELRLACRGKMKRDAVIAIQAIALVAFIYWYWL